MASAGKSYSVFEMRTMYGNNGVPLSQKTWRRWIAPIDEKLRHSDGRKVRIYTPAQACIIFELLGRPDKD